MRLTEAQQRAIDSTPRLELASASRMRLFLGGQEYSAFVEEPRYYGEDGVPVVLETKVWERVPRRYKYKPCEIVWEIADEEVAGFKGEVVMLDVKGYTTDLIAATTGYWAEDTQIGHGMDLVKARPSDVLFEAAVTLPYPDVDIPVVERPKITRTGQDSIQWTAKASEVFDLVKEESGMVLQDSPLGVARGRRRLSVNTDSASKWTFEEGIDIPEGELEVGDITLDRKGVTEELERRYAFVSVYRVVEGEPVELARVEVDNGDEVAPRGSVFPVELTDDETESPWEVGVVEARRLGENRASLSFPTVYSPFWLERGDPVTIVGQEIASRGTYRHTYRARLTNVSCEAVAGSMKAVGALVGTSTLR